METLALRKSIKSYIDKADDRMLELIYAMLNRDEQIIVAYTSNGIALNKEEYKNLLDESFNEVRNELIISQEDLESEVENW